MKTLVLAALIAALPSFAAMAQTSTTSPMPTPAPSDQDAPLPGANSYTEDQAKSRLESNGYTNVMGLKTDENGI